MAISTITIKSTSKRATSREDGGLPSGRVVPQRGDTRPTYRSAGDHRRASSQQATDLLKFVVVDPDCEA
jgi:hypothetical protein